MKRRTDPKIPIPSSTPKVAPSILDARWGWLSWILLGAAMVLVFLVRVEALKFSGLEQRAANQARVQKTDPALALESLLASSTYRVEDGRRFLYAPGFDTYVWLRATRNYLARGRSCDEIVGGTCRNTYSNAPVGREQLYGSSLHVIGLAWVHRVFSWWDPGRPLEASAPWLSILLGVLAVIPVFAIGRRLAGDIAGFVAGPLAMLHPDLLFRSAGADNDIWNVVLPIVSVWFVMHATAATSRTRSVVYSILAGVVVGLHAWVWSGWLFGFGILWAGLGGYAALCFVNLTFARWRKDEEASERQRARVGFSVLVLATFTLATVASVGTLDSWETVIDAPSQIAADLSARVRAADPHVGAQNVFHPDTFKTVLELVSPGENFDARILGGPVFFFLAWLGLLFSLVPPDRIGVGHLGLVLAGNVLFRSVWWAEGLAPNLFALALFGPLAVALATIAWFDRDSENYLSAPTLIVLVWFVAAAVLSRQGLRFQMFLAAPFGIAVGVFFGRVHVWARSVAGAWLKRALLGDSPARCSPSQHAARARFERRGAVSVTVMQGLVFVAAILVLVSPARTAREMFRKMVPQMNAAWAAVLENVEENTPRETIVHSPWDYGYWIQYFADRRTINDGGSLGTSIPYWFARAMLASSDAETAGIIRMLNCGSAAVSGPAAEFSAARRLAQSGVHPSMAPWLLGRLASDSREDALRRLEDEGILGEDAEYILEATHCAAPPSVVIVPSRLARGNGWLYLGNWDHRKAYVAYRSTQMAEDEAVREMVDELRYEAKEATRLYRQASRLEADEYPAQFISDLHGFAKFGWSSCQRDAPSEVWICPVGGRVKGGWGVESIEYRVDAEEGVSGAGAWLFDGGKRRFVEPGRLLIADGTRVRLVVDHAANPATPEPQASLGVLMDTVEHRVLVGTPTIVASGFVRFFFLDPVYSPSFRLVEDHLGYGGERLVVWASGE